MKRYDCSERFLSKLDTSQRLRGGSVKQEGIRRDKEEGEDREDEPYCGRQEERKKRDGFEKRKGLLYFKRILQNFMKLHSGY